jgi:hypothetical protein
MWSCRHFSGSPMRSKSYVWVVVRVGLMVVGVPLGLEFANDDARGLLR